MRKPNSLIQLMLYMYYWLLFFKNDNLKCTSCFFYYLFSNSHAQRNIRSIIYIAYHILSDFLLCNVLLSVGSLYWSTFVKELLLLRYSQQIISAVANESLIPYNIKRAPETQNLNCNTEYHPKPNQKNIK